MSNKDGISPYVDFRDPGVRHVIDRYLDTMVRVLTRTGFDQPYAPYWKPLASPERQIYDRDRQRFHARGIELVRRNPVDPERRRLGLDWPIDAETMVGEMRLRNLVDCVRRVIEDDVPGDLLEAGVWRGGATIMMRAVLEAYADVGRTVWVADSFEGLPKPDPAYPADTGDELWTHKDYLGVSRAEVERNFARYDLLDDQVRFIEGWFKDTLRSAPVGRLAVLRLDADMYQSTMDILEPLYPRVSPGGFVIVDDYWVIAACRKAVDEYRDRHGITNPILEIDGSGVFWQVGVGS